MFEAIVAGDPSGSARCARLPPARHVSRRSRRRDRRSVPLRPRAHRLRPAPASAKARTTARSRSSARTASRSGRRPACTSPCGRRTPIASASSATSTAGTAACTRCGCSCRRASGRSSFPICPTARSTSSRSARSAGALLKKTDPFGVAFEVPPQIGVDRPRHLAATSGATTTWMATRPARGGWLDRPMSIYEVHLGSWARVPEEGNRFLTLPRAGAAGSCRT